MANKAKNGKATKAPKAAPVVTFHDGLKTSTDARKALEARDKIAVERYSDELEAKRLTNLVMIDYLFDILARPGIKAMPKPGAAVVRTMITEKGLTPFTANRYWAEFKLVCHTNADAD
jgi:hypothetical protein